MRLADCTGWLPADKRAAVCFCIDDVHPAGSQDHFDAGGDLGHGALGWAEWLLERHPRLRITLFVTPDWRLRDIARTRRWLARVPLLRERVHWAPLAPKGRFRVDRFPQFVAYLNSLPRTDCAVHGLHHAHVGPRRATEFQEQSRERCRTMVREARRIFEAAGLRHVAGFAAPAWNTPPSLCAALHDTGFRFVASARDLQTPVSRRARTAMSGLRGASLIHPTWIDCTGDSGSRAMGAQATAAQGSGEQGSGARAMGVQATGAQTCRLVHFTTNFQATSTLERARAIVEAGGLLLIKAHIFKSGGGITMLDGLDAAYCRYLDHLWRALDGSYGDSLWWTSMEEVANRCRALAN